MRTFTLTLFLLLSFCGLSQNAVSEKDQRIIRTEVHRLINELRVSKGVVPLLRSDTLIDAAQLQADYQAKTDEVSHDQKNRAAATPTNRVKLSGGKDFEAVGENCIAVNTEYSSKKKVLIAIATEMFVGWKESSGHYKNMVNPTYVFGDLAFSYNPQSKRMYGTQVFGSRGVLIEGQLSNNAFGITEGKDDCEQKYAGFQNLLANMGNSIQMDGNEVVLYYHNINYWDKIFTGPQDGLAVDLVFRDQFDCGKPNELDVSTIYDGVMLKPKYKDEMMANNRAESDYRLITAIGEVPDQYLGRDMQVSLIVLDNGKKCKYLVPAKVPNKAYNLRPIEPFMDNPSNSVLNSSGIILSQELIYDFESGNARPLEYPTITNEEETVHSIEIVCYTSIEGDTIINNQLHNNRAKTIEKHIRKTLRFPDSALVVTAEENWDKMNYQLQYFFADTLLAWPKDSIRKLSRSDDKTLPWDSLLFAQRRSAAIINYQGTVDENSSQAEYLKLNLKTAIAAEDWDKANRALYEAYKDSNISKFERFEIILDPFVFETIKKRPELVKNAAAMMTHAVQWGAEPSIEFINAWITRKDEVSTEALSNIIHLYTLTSLKLLDRWDVPSSRLANVIHPDKVNVLSADRLSEELVLNLHLTFIQYYGQINYSPGILTSFDFISDYFRENSLSLEDDVDLSLFFNSWSRYDLTVSYLGEKFKKNTINEDGVFLLLQTWFFYADNDLAIYEEIHEKAIALNPERYCDYIYQNFQTLRKSSIKNSYCEVCQK